MNRVIIDLEALKQNIQVISGIMDRAGIGWSVSTQALCGHPDIIRALSILGVRSICDTKLLNLRSIRQAVPDLETWYLGLPLLSNAAEVVELADISVNSELEVVRALNKEAGRLGRKHHIVILVEIGDLYEGVMPASLVSFYEQVLALGNVDIIGLGAVLPDTPENLPELDQIAHLKLYRELLELKFNTRLQFISAGSSSLLSVLLSGEIPDCINHFRIGETLFLGNDPLSGTRFEGLRNDVVTLEAEIAEIKEKSLVPTGEIGHAAPFEGSAQAEEASPGQRGYRALVTVGGIDTDVAGLTPLNPAHQIAGASSDITVVNMGESKENWTIGDVIRFRPNLSAFRLLMTDSYLPKHVEPPLRNFEKDMPKRWNIEVPASLQEIDESRENAQGAAKTTAT